MVKCSHCQAVKDESQFHRNRSTKMGYQKLCKDCQRDADRDWRGRHHGSVLRIVHRRLLPGGQREKYVAKNRERIQKYMADYHVAHRENWKGYRQNRRARIRFNGGSFTGKEWKDLCDKYGNVCLCCRQSVPLVPDHIVPLSKGGKNAIENIQPLCQPCNRKKHMRIIDYRW